MALINTGPDYTRSGDNFLTKLSNGLSFLPFGGGINWFIGMAGAAMDAAGWLVRGKFGSAATVLAAGAVRTTLNTAASSVLPGGKLLWWGVNAGSGVISGSTIGTHGRALTEGAIGAVTGALGFKPTVLQSYTAGVGSISAGPGAFARRISGERGQDANAAYANFRNGAGADHVAALEASRAAGPNYRTV